MSWRFAAKPALPENERKSMSEFLNTPITRRHDPLRTQPACSSTVWPRETPSLTRAELGNNGLTSWDVHVEICRDSRRSGRPKCPKTHWCPSSLQRSWSVAWRDKMFCAVFYRWQKEFFENGPAALESPRRASDSKDQRIALLEQKLQPKHEVLSELMEEHSK